MSNSYKTNKLYFTFFLLVNLLVFQEKPVCQVITTFSGNYYVGLGFSGDGSLASNAQFNVLAGIAADPSGNMYVADKSNHRIRKIDFTTNIVSTYAGIGVSGYTGDNGLATAAEISFPEEVTTDKFGNLYIADDNNCVRRVDATTHIITTVAGNGTRGFSGDGGLATSAQLFGPLGMVFDNSSNLYIADNNNSRVRKVDAVTGVINTFAGNGSFGYSGDGSLAVSAQLNNPGALSIDATGNLLIADRNNHCIRRVDHVSNLISTITGNGTAGTSGDGSSAVLAQLSFPSGVYIDGPGNIYITDLSERVRVINASTGVINTIAGNGTAGHSGDGGPAILATLNNPSSPVVDANGNLYFSDLTNNRIRKVDHLTGFISNFAGDYVPFAGDGGPGINAVYSLPIDVEFDNSGNLFVVDMNNNRIRKIDAITKAITTIAGNGTNGFSGDGGPADAAAINLPQDIAIDKSGNIYVADYHNSRIRKIEGVTNIITTVAGNGTSGTAGRGGLATNAELLGPNGVALDKDGNIFIADFFESTIDKVDAVTQIITVVAGQSGLSGYTGDGGLATSATLYFPNSVDVDNLGNLYISDIANNSIRMVNATTHVITTIVGTGVAGSSGDGGLATAATISGPWKVKLDQANNLYVSESNRIRKIDQNTKIISTVVGTGGAGYSGDGGSPTLAELHTPVGVAFDGSGNTFIADYGNNVIREIVSSALPATLLSFVGQLSDQNETVLNWTSGIEEGTLYYEIQYSIDTSQFSQLSQLQAKGQSSTYTFTHCCPHPGDNFYRLKMVDQDGKFTYSPIVLVKYNQDETGLRIFPNPSSDIVTIRYPISSNEEQIRIINTSGDVVRLLQLPKRSTEYSVSLKAMPKGTYWIQFTTRNLASAKLLLQ